MYLSTKRFISKEDAEELEDFLYNHFYPAYLLNKIKDQTQNL